MHIDFCGRAHGGSIYIYYTILYMRVCVRVQNTPWGSFTQVEEEKRLGREKKKKKRRHSTTTSGSRGCMRFGVFSSSSSCTVSSVTEPCVYNEWLHSLRSSRKFFCYFFRSVNFSNEKIEETHRQTTTTTTEKIILSQTADVETIRSGYPWIRSGWIYVSH